MWNSFALATRITYRSQPSSSTGPGPDERHKNRFMNAILEDNVIKFTPDLRDDDPLRHALLTAVERKASPFPAEVSRINTGTQKKTEMLFCDHVTALPDYEFKGNRYGTLDTTNESRFEMKYVQTTPEFVSNFRNHIRDKYKLNSIEKNYKIYLKPCPVNAKITIDWLLGNLSYVSIDGPRFRGENPEMIHDIFRLLTTELRQEPLDEIPSMNLGDEE